MKKSLIIAILAIMSLIILPAISCKKSDTAQKPQSLSLKAPSGQQIAQSVTALRTEASGIISKKFGGKQDFEITNIDYLPVNQGYAAIISYRISSGETGNFASFSGIRFKISSQSITTDYPTAQYLSGNAEAQNADAGKITITCTRNGTCECKVQGTVDTNTGIVTWGCSCEQCTATVTYG